MTFIHQFSDIIPKNGKFYKYHCPNCKHNWFPTQENFMQPEIFCPKCRCMIERYIVKNQNGNIPIISIEFD